MTTALIVVDVQRDFCEGGSLAVSGGAETAARISDHIDNSSYIHVLATRDHHIDPGSHFSDDPDFVDSWPPHCVVGTPGVEFHDELTFRDFDAVFDKGENSAAYSGFEGSADGVSLADWLRQHDVDTVDICGIATDYCVKATALDAVAEGFEARVIWDLTAAVSKANIPSVLDDFTHGGVKVMSAP